MDSTPIIAAARKVALDLGCAGTPEHDRIAAAFEKFADLIEQGRPAGDMFRSAGMTMDTGPRPRLKTARTDAGMTLSELSRRSGVAKSYLSTLENDRTGDRRPSAQTLAAIAKALGVPLDALIG